MMGKSKIWLPKIPLRLRLTVWYILLLSLTLLIFSGYLYFKLEQKESAHSQAIVEMELRLKLLATQLIEEVELKGDRPFFKPNNNLSRFSDRFKNPSLAARLISDNGEVWDGYGSYQVAPIWLPQAAGYAYIPNDENIWYIYSQPIGQNWLQVMESFKSSYEIAEELIKNIILISPIVLFLTKIKFVAILNQSNSVIYCWLLSSQYVL